MKVYTLAGVPYVPVVTTSGIVLRKAGKRSPAPGQLGLFDAQHQEGETRTNQAGHQEVLQGGRWHLADKPGPAQQQPAQPQQQPQAQQPAQPQQPQQPAPTIESLHALHQQVAQTHGIAPSQNDPLAAALPVIEKWVNNPKSVSTKEMKNLTDVAKTSQTKQPKLERIFGTDPSFSIGEIIDLQATSFTGVDVSGGKSAGEISWKSGDEALAKIDNPVRGLDIPYSSIKTQFAASSEKETLVAGKYRVKQIIEVPEPDTNPDYGYKVKQYILEEV